MTANKTTATANNSATNSVLSHEIVKMQQARELQTLAENVISECKISACELLIQDSTTKSAVFRKNDAQCIQLDFSKTSNRVRDRIQAQCYNAHFELWVGDNVNVNTSAFEQYRALNRFKTAESLFSFKSNAYEQFKTALENVLRQFTTVTAKKTETTAKKTDSAKKTSAKKTATKKAKKTDKIA